MADKQLHVTAGAGSGRPWAPAVTAPASRPLGHLEAVFVQSAKKFSSGGDTVTLGGVSPTLYFASRPTWEVGQLQTRDFVALWDHGERSFAEEPPSAVLAFFDPLLQADEAPPDDVTVVLRDPVLLGDALTYAIEVVAGIVPADTGGCSVFIDVSSGSIAPFAVG